MNHSNNNSNSNSDAASRTAAAMHDNLELEHRYNAVETFLQLVGLDPDAVVEFMRRKERTVEEVRIFAGKTV